MYRHPQGRYEVIEVMGVNSMGDTYRIREAVLTPQRDVRGMLSEADWTFAEQLHKKAYTKVSDEEVREICKLYKQNIDIPKIADHVGRGVDMIRRVLDREGLKKREPKSRPWTEKERKTVMRMWFQKCSTREIATAVGRTCHAVSTEIYSMKKQNVL